MRIEPDYEVHHIFDAVHVHNGPDGPVEREIALTIVLKGSRETWEAYTGFTLDGTQPLYGQLVDRLDEIA